MRKINLNINQKLAIGALILGFISIFLGNPQKISRVTVNTEDIALSIKDTNSQISPLKLAEWIIQGKTDFRLIDVRNATQYSEYFIPGAENIPITEINESGLMRNESIILYSDDDLASAQSWFLLKSKGYKAAYLLRGGIEGWKSSVLFPVITDKSQNSEKLIEISGFFGGKPMSPASTSEQQELTIKSVPKPQVPLPSVSAPKKGKPKKEGC